MSKVFKVFLASSGELKQEREEIKKYINNYQSVYIKFELVMWEDMSMSFTNNGIQKDTINPALRSSDVVITLFHSKVGKFTQEEFDIALEGINNHSKPNYLFFYYTNIEKYPINQKDRLVRKEYDKVLELIDYVTEKEQLPLEFDSTPMLISNIETQLRLIEKKELHPESEEPTSSKATKNKEQETKKSEYIKRVAILSASPINEKSLYDLNEIFEMFEKFNIELEYLVLNEENLYELDDFESVFIFTQTNKKQIMIEDEYFISKYIDLESINDIFKTYEHDYIHMFTFENTLEKISDFIYIDSVKKDLRKFIHDTYKKLFQKGTCRLEKNITSISANFKSTKKLKDFVGRENDIRNIIRDILELHKSKEVYTVLGSGGMGKTTLIRKVVQELSIRAKFKDGIQFVDCEFLKDYIDFEQKVAIAFDMTNAINFKDQLEEQKETHRLIILDNVETLLYVERTSDIKEIIELIDFISEYSTIVITSREKLDNGNEMLYALTDLQLDDAEDLFMRKSNIPTLNNEDRKFLRDIILDELLNKNPLAIELVAGLRLNIYDLEKELRNNFFDTTKDKTIKSVFANQSDFNITKSKSLFHSIGMSYKGLEEKHKLMFELLSLFPDGLHKKNFITFFNSEKEKNNKYKITFTDVNILEDKSIINVNDDYIKLQSIIGRFAEHMFNENNLQKDYYYQKAYSYNQYILYDIKEINQKNNPLAVSLFMKNKNNFLKSFDNIHLLEHNEYILQYIDDVATFFTMNTSPDAKVVLKLFNLKNKFTHIDEKELFFDSVILRLKYYFGEFGTTYNEIKEKYPLQSLLNNYSNSLISKISLDNLSVVYDMEGMQYEVVKGYLKLNEISNKSISWTTFFNLGEFKFCNKVYNNVKFTNGVQNNFFQFEFELNTNTLNIDKVKLHLSRLYKTQYLDKVEFTYSSFKYNREDVSLREIENLIVTNPYTYGLKSLMKAIKDDQNSSKYDYEDALKHLYHIRYYYTEGILLYCRYLKDLNDEEYEKWLNKGKELAYKHHYKFLMHQFKCLETNVCKEYNEDDYPLPEKLDYSGVIKKYNLKGLE